MKKFFYILFFLFFNSAISQINVFVKLDTNTILIGEQTQLTLGLNYPIKNGDSVSVLFPQLYDTINKNIEIIKTHKLDTLIKTNAIELTQKYTITSFDTGFFVIKPFCFLANGDSLFTEPILFNVKTVEVDTSKAIYDIKQPLEVPFSLKEWLKEHWLALAAVLTGLLLIAALIYYIKKRKKSVPVEPPKPKVPLHEIYLNRLIETKSKKLWQEGKYKEYYSEISDTIREYLEERFGIKALEQTTDEILASIKYKPVDEKVIAMLYELLTMADLVKFAKEKPLQDQNEKAYQWAVEIIHLTKNDELYR